jgi:hydrogenase-4 component E
MTTFLILIYSVTLIYSTITERFRTYAGIIGVQGFILFVLSVVELGKISTLNLIFIIAETILFKTIIVPFLLFRIIQRTQYPRVHQHALPGYYAVLLEAVLLLISYLIASSLGQPMIDSIYLTISLFAIFTGLLLIISHRKVFSHLVGFLVLENAVFLFSLAIGNEMPILINTGILLDIFITVLILGAFATRMGRVTENIESDDLAQLKD